MARAWKSHKLAQSSKTDDPCLKVDYFPRGECFTAEFPHYGRLTHDIAVGRLLLWSWCHQNSAFLPPSKFKIFRDNSSTWSSETQSLLTVQKVPEVLQICDPAGAHTVTFALPLEERKTMLPFELKDACRPWKP